MNPSKSPLQRLAFALACLLLLATPQFLYADDLEEVSEHLMRAEAALHDKHYRAAASEYLQAAELSDEPEIAQRATQVAYSYGFNEEALKAARRWARLDPGNDSALLYVSQLYLRTGNIRRSQRSFEKLLKRGTDPAADRLLALIPILSQEDPDKAYELMLRLAKSHRESAEAHYAVAVMALQAGETGVAGERALKASEIAPDWVKPQLIYARAMLFGGDEEGAIDYTSRLVGDDPAPDPEARIELAIMLLSAGRDDDALSQVNQILLEQPARTDALRLMAIINFRLDRLDAARDDFQDLLQSGHFSMDALYYLGRIADRDANLDEAVRYYAQVTHGNNAIISQRRAAGIMAQEGDDEKALEHLARFAEISPNHAVDMLQARAQLLATMERYPEALENYDLVVAYRPDAEEVHLGRAEILLQMGRVDDAIAVYRKSARRWPDSATTLNALGYTLADRTDEYDEAERLISKALELNPDSAAIIDSWGWVLFRQGQNAEALIHLERAYERFRDPEVASHIIEVLWALDRRDDAVTLLENAELLFPDNELLESVRERLVPDTP